MKRVGPAHEGTTDGNTSRSAPMMIDAVLPIPITGWVMVAYRKSEAPGDAVIRNHYPNHQT